MREELRGDVESDREEHLSRALTLDISLRSLKSKTRIPTGVADFEGTIQATDNG